MKMVKVLMGYDLAQGFSEDEHDRWLQEVHLPDMAKVPGLERVILNRTGQIVIGDDLPKYIAELHYTDMNTYLVARSWIKRNPFPTDSQPDGRIEIKYMFICESKSLKG